MCAHVRQQVVTTATGLGVVALVTRGQTYPADMFVYDPSYVFVLYDVYCRTACTQQTVCQATGLAGMGTGGVGKRPRSGGGGGGSRGALCGRGVWTGHGGRGGRHHRPHSDVVCCAADGDVGAGAAAGGDGLSRLFVDVTDQVRCTHMCCCSTIVHKGTCRHRRRCC